MQKWEYKYLIISAKKVENELNALGNEGWEVVNMEVAPLQLVCLLKRPKS